jgi:hypothetical protein
MKKILLLVTTIGIYSYAGMFSTMSGMTMEEIKPLSSYTIDTAGINPRVYEFIPKNDKTKLCIVVFGNSDKLSVPAMQCFERKTSK